MSMSTVFVAQIHNNSLGKCVEVDSYKEGVEKIVEWAESQLERKLTEEELEEVENDYELYNDEDMDNIFCWSIGSFDMK